MKDGWTTEQQEIDKEIKRVVGTVMKLPEPDKSKSLLCLAFEYFNLDMEEEGFDLIGKTDPGYYKNQLPKDMEKDKDINRIVMTIISKLITAGYIRTSESKDG